MSSDSNDGIIKYNVNEGLWYKYIYVHIYVFMFICIYCICIYLFTLLAHVAPSNCEVRLFISKRATEVPDKPITKSQTLANTQQSTCAAFMHRLLDVITGRLCAWPPGIKKASCPNCLLDTGSVVLEKRGGAVLFPSWQQQQHLSHTLPWEVIFMPHDRLLTLNQYHLNNWAP